jgi:hypothetical protein
MKKIYLGIIILLLCPKLFAQPVLNNSYFPVVGKAFSGRSFYKAVPLPPISEGPNQNWDFSGLDSVYITDYNFAFRVKNVSATDSGVKFPGAQVAMVSFFGSDSIENFYAYNGDDLENLGFNVKGVPWNEKFLSPRRVEFRSNLDFGDLFIRTSQSTKNIGALRTYQRYRDTITYAGYGTVTTPFGTYQNVPMLKLNYSIDMSFTPTNLQLNNYGRHWLWFLPGYGQPYFRYTEDVDVNVPDAVRYEGYVGFIPTISTQDRIRENALQIFPNRIQNGHEILLSGQREGGKVKIEVMDTQGKVVFKSQISDGRFSLNGLKSGLYLVHLQEDERLYTSRLIVE